MTCCNGSSKNGCPSPWHFLAKALIKGWHLALLLKNGLSPFSAAKEVWSTPKLTIDTSLPIETNIPTLFVTGDLDCRTPVKQIEEIMTGFKTAYHITVLNAGHEQAMWHKTTFDETIPKFLSGKPIESSEVKYPSIQFIPIKGPAAGHPSLK